MIYTNLYPVIPAFGYNFANAKSKEDLDTFSQIGVRVGWFVLVNFIDVVAYVHLPWQATLFVYVPLKITLLTISVMILFAKVMSTK